jgi:hypothetical protein
LTRVSATKVPASKVPALIVPVAGVIILGISAFQGTLRLPDAADLSFDIVTLGVLCCN